MKIGNRELSWLSFNNRVLQEANDETVPLVQRLRFLGIFSNNQDEFIKVRLAGLIRLCRMKNAKTDDGYKLKQLIEEVDDGIKRSKVTFNEIYNNILPELAENGVFLLNETQLNEEQVDFCINYFTNEVSSWLIPIMLRKSTKIPFLSDNVVYLAVKMSSCHLKNNKYAILPLPVSKNCPRYIVLPSIKSRKEIILIDDIIRLCLDEIFYMFNYEVISAFTFKILRDGDFNIDDDLSKSLIEKMERGLEDRTHGEPIRMFYDADMPEDILEILLSKFKLNKDEVFCSGRYTMMRDLMNFPKICPDLEIKNPQPLHHPLLGLETTIVDVIKKRDIFLNYPYHTFNHVVDFLREAAIDSKVRKICITLYRTAKFSKVINVLINAVKNGKEVIVLSELMARFDEEQNVEIADFLQKSGVTVIHGVKGLKVHSKLIYVERVESGQTKGYVYVGTGNFNENTAKIYTDFGLLTSNQRIASDAKTFFDFLENMHKHYSYKELLVSPYFMRKEFEILIEKEIKNKQKGKQAAISAKFNSLTDTGIIKLLYKAAQAGVKIKLLIRGACCLIPDQKGLNENIEVRSIVDKYLEHSRMVIFHNGGEERIFILSADWMARNLDYRIEVGVPIYDKKVRKTIKDIFRIQWSDNVKARDLANQDENRYIVNDLEKVRSQISLYDYFKNV